MTDPFDQLRADDGPVVPRPEFAAGLRSRLQLALVRTRPTVDLPPRRNPVSATAPTHVRRLTAYLTVDDGDAAISFYRDALGAREVERYVGDDGVLGHATLALGDVELYLSEEHPALGVVSPPTVGGTTVALHVTVDGVDAAHARAVELGASSLQEPADQPHGARHATIVDPFGHRWMLSQPLADLTDAELVERMGAAGFERTTPNRSGIWSAINAVDAPAMIRFVVDVLGFEEELVVPGDEPGVVVHSQLRWPEGGVVQVGTADRPGNVFSQQAAGQANVYVITADPWEVHRRCTAAGVDVLSEPSAPDYDPDGAMFSLRDAEGNLWTFGTYAGG